MYKAGVCIETHRGAALESSNVWQVLTGRDVTRASDHNPFEGLTRHEFASISGGNEITSQLKLHLSIFPFFTWEIGGERLKSIGRFTLDVAFGLLVRFEAVDKIAVTIQGKVEILFPFLRLLSLALRLSLLKVSCVSLTTVTPPHRLRLWFLLLNRAALHLTVPLSMVHQGVFSILSTLPFAIGQVQVRRLVQRGKLCVVWSDVPPAHLCFCADPFEPSTPR